MVENTYSRRNALKWISATGSLLLTGSTVNAQSNPSNNGSYSNSDRKEILVGVTRPEQDENTPSSTRAAVESYLPENADIVHENESLRYVTVRFPEVTTDNTLSTFINSIVERPHIAYTEINGKGSADNHITDPRFEDQYAPQMVSADTVWHDSDGTFGSESVTIAILDTGVDYTHPDLTGQFGSNKGYDFVSDDSDPFPVDSNVYHGTSVAGIASATTQNGAGIAGISNSRLIAGRVIDETDTVYVSDISDALEWAANQNADIANCSLSFGGGYNTLKRAVDYAYDNDTLVVASAGNEDRNPGGPVRYPAAYREALAITAVDENRNFQNGYRQGPEVDLTAPGVNVLTTYINNSYTNFTGTSASAPVVSGVAGLVVAGNPNISAAELIAHLQNTATDLGLPSDKQGEGLVNANRAFNDPVEPDPVINNSPTDVDNDTRYEDIDGDQILAYDDPEQFFANYQNIRNREDSALFDFNNNGEIDYDDQRALFEEV